VISGSVGSARSQLFMPGLHHAHTLQHPKKIFVDAHPRESVLTNINYETKEKHNISKRLVAKNNYDDEYTSPSYPFSVLLCVGMV